MPSLTGSLEHHCLSIACSMLTLLDRPAKVILATLL